jgi:hypothetical protein
MLVRQAPAEATGCTTALRISQMRRKLCGCEVPKHHGACSLRLPPPPSLPDGRRNLLGKPVLN